MILSVSRTHTKANKNKKKVSAGQRTSVFFFLPPQIRNSVFSSSGNEDDFFRFMGGGGQEINLLFISLRVICAKTSSLRENIFSPTGFHFITSPPKKKQAKNPKATCPNKRFPSKKMIVELFFSCLNWPPNCENGFFSLTHIFPYATTGVKWNFFQSISFGLGWASSTKEEENLLIQLEKRTPPIIVSQTAMGKNGGILLPSFFF